VLLGIPSDVAVSPNRLLTTAQAAGYLAIEVHTFRAYRRRGVIDLPAVFFTPNGCRYYRLADLDRVIMERSSRLTTGSLHKPWKDDDDIPYAIIAKLIGVAPASVFEYTDTPRNKGKKPVNIKNRKIPAIVEYLRYQWKRELLAEIRDQYAFKIIRLQQKIRYLEKRAMRPYSRSTEVQP
jgi:Helix-turn-helix domain